MENQEAIEEAFNWLVDAYDHNAKQKIPSTYISPFIETHRYKDRRSVYEGGSETFLKDYGIFDLIEKWLYPTERRYLITRFSSYISVVRDVCLVYIANFSLQRISEVLTLHSDCFLTENDERLGEIGLIVGETTKIEPDDDARWVVPMIVKKAVDAAASIARMRVRHCPKGIASLLPEDGSIPLAIHSWEPWNRGGANTISLENFDYALFQKRKSRIFDPKEIAVTEEDWKIARSLTPNLDEKEGFGVSIPWRFTAHQLRRTTNVNMFSSNMVSDKSLQWEMKHLTRDMTLYYGRNYSNLRLNSEAESLVIIESYQAIYRQLVDVVENNIDYVRPHQKEFLPDGLINLIDDREENKLVQLIKKGSVGFRITQLGFCMKTANCEYGGIESAAKCSGALGGGICADAIFARSNKKKLARLKQAYEAEIQMLKKDSPRHSALTKEIYAIGVYLNVVGQ